MDSSSRAGRRLAIALLAAAALWGCRGASDAEAVTALVARFMDLQASTGPAPRVEDLKEIFTGMDEAAALSVTSRLEPVARDLRYAVEEVRFRPFGGAVVTVALGGGDSRSTLVMRARKVRGAWKLDPSFHVRQRIGEIRLPDP